MPTATRKKGTYQQAGEQLIRLLEIMERLRSQDGCPWDRRQNSRTLRPYLIEEAYEVIEAIDADDFDGLCEELGDLLLQIVFHAQIHSEENRFEMHNVICAIADKMERRHPHVFGDLDCTCETALRKRWEQIKKLEQESKPPENRRKTAPRHLPALLKAQKIVQKSNQQSNDSPDSTDCLPTSIRQGLNSLRKLDRETLAECLPEVLLEIVNIAESQKIDCELDFNTHLDKLIASPL